MNRSPLVVVGCLLLSLSASAEPPRNVTVRGSLGNARIVFESTGRGRVAFIGGSITEMNGYRPMVADWLQKRFPKTEFAFTNAGISSTCSTTGAFRLQRDVLEPTDGVDLLFVEFAVNDDQDAGHAAREALRGMEGVVRRARLANPNVEIVVTYFVNPSMLKQLQEGRVPVPMAAHEKVAAHYGVPTVHLAREVADRIGDETLTWAKYGGTHPKPFGNAVAAKMVTDLLAHVWRDPVGEEDATKPHDLPKPLDAHSYFDGSLSLPTGPVVPTGWTIGEPAWKTIPGSLRQRYAGRKLLHGSDDASPLAFTFHGRGVGAYVLAGPDAATVEVRIDEGEWKRVDLYHRFSKGLHYPRTVMFFTDLESGRHTLELRIAEKPNAASKGRAVRIVGWAVNGS